MSVKKSGLGLLNIMASTNKKCLSLKRASTEFIQAVTGEGVFYNADHLLVLREERCDGEKTGMTSTMPNSGKYLHTLMEMNVI